MERLPEPLTTFRQFVEADLWRAARLIVKVQDEIDPQFRFATPDGDYHLAVTLPGDGRERQLMLQRVSTFMAWKQAASFILASELSEPDCVYALGVSHREVHACLVRVRRHPRPWDASSFGTVEWLARDQVGQEMVDLLPRGARAISTTELAMLEKWFGASGKFPAVHVPSGEVFSVSQSQ
jgi:hypothetical protein